MIFNDFTTEFSLLSNQLKARSDHVFAAKC